MPHFLKILCVTLISFLTHFALAASAHAFTMDMHLASASVGLEVQTPTNNNHPIPKRPQTSAKRTPMAWVQPKGRDVAPKRKNKASTLTRNSRFYFGASLGTQQLKNTGFYMHVPKVNVGDRDSHTPNQDSQSFSHGHNQTSGGVKKIILGINLHRSVAMELSCAQLGTLSHNAIVDTKIDPPEGGKTPSYVTNVKLQAKAKIKSCGMSIVGRMPIRKNLTLSGQLGINKTHTKGYLHRSTTHNTKLDLVPDIFTPINYSLSKKEHRNIFIPYKTTKFHIKQNTTKLGLGLEYAFNKKWRLRLEAERLYGLGDDKMMKKTNLDSMFATVLFEL